jgi:hypothetical protein
MSFILFLKTSDVAFHNSRICPSQSLLVSNVGDTISKATRHLILAYYTECEVNMKCLKVIANHRWDNFGLRSG